MLTYTHEEQCRLWLQSAQSLSWRTREALLSYFGSAEQIFDQMGPSVQMMAGDKAYAELLQMKTAGPEALVDRLHRAGAEIVFCGQAGYPALLGEIKDPPHALFIRGTPAKDEISVAIVGSRRDTRYGRSQAFSIARDLAAAGVTVVSGLARGIDTAAHEGALAGGGRTVAVLGNGIDRVYPEENTRLAQSIAEHGGAVVSEFPLGSEPLSHHFPIRNRIISGISAALLLIEGNAHSGTMITAGYAAEQGREVFALPGMVDVPGSIAPLRLLREGANLCTCARDILEDMRWLREETPPKAEASKPQAPDNLNEAQKMIAALLEREEMRFEELTEKTGLSPDRLSGELTMMELDGIVEARAGRAYALKR